MWRHIPADTALPLSYRSTRLRAGLEPATCRLGVDNRNRSGPQQVRSSRLNLLRYVAESNRFAIDNRTARPATNHPSRPARTRTRPARLELAVLPLYTTGLESRRPGSNGVLVAVSARCSSDELRPPKWYARLESNQRPLPSQSSALSTELRAWEEPPAGVEPAPRPYKGRVLAVDTTEAKVETAGVEPAPPRCKRGCSSMQSFIPKVRTGGVEPPQREATGLQPAELTDAQRPREG